MPHDHKKQLPMFIPKFEVGTLFYSSTNSRCITTQCGGMICFIYSDIWISALHLTLSEYIHCRTRGYSRPPGTCLPPIGDAFKSRIQSQQPFWRSIVMLDRGSFSSTVKKGMLRVFNHSLYDINNAIEPKDQKEWLLENVVPKQYPEFLPLFSKFWQMNCLGSDQVLINRNGQRNVKHRSGVHDSVSNESE